MTIVVGSIALMGCSGSPSSMNPTLPSEGVSSIPVSTPVPGSIPAPDTVATSDTTASGESTNPAATTKPGDTGTTSSGGEVGSSFSQTPTKSSGSVESQVLSGLLAADNAVVKTMNVLTLAKTMDQLASKYGVRIEIHGGGGVYKVTYTDGARCYASEVAQGSTGSVLTRTSC